MTPFEHLLQTIADLSAAVAVLAGGAALILAFVQNTVATFWRR